MKNIYLIVGKSGCGKSTIVHELCSKYNYTEVQSYTERPKRYEDEIGHIFVTKEEFDKLPDLCAYTVFNGNRYGVPSSMIDECDLYVIDPAGVIYMKEHYKGYKNIIVIGIKNDDDAQIDRDIRFTRMTQRGDSDDAAKERINHDEAAFTNWERLLNYTVINKDLYSAVNNVEMLIEAMEEK